MLFSLCLVVHVEFEVEQSGKCYNVIFVIVSDCKCI